MIPGATAPTAIPRTLELPGPDSFPHGGPLPDEPGEFGMPPASRHQYSLFINFVIGNLNPFPIQFETIVIRFDHGPGIRRMDDCVEQTTIFTETGTIASHFSYAPVHYVESPSDDDPRQWEIESRKGVGLSAFSLGAHREIGKTYSMRFSVHLYHRCVAISRQVHAVIPHDVSIPVRPPHHPSSEPFEGLPIAFSE